eukprot:34918-Pleurochrysis_carterae.AAC.3
MHAQPRKRPREGNSEVANDWRTSTRSTEQKQTPIRPVPILTEPPPPLLIRRRLQRRQPGLVCNRGRRANLEQPRDDLREAGARQRVHRRVALKRLGEVELRVELEQHIKRGHAVDAVVAERQHEDRRAAVARCVVNRLWVHLQDHLNHVARAVGHGVVHGREPLLQPVVAPRVGAGLQQHPHQLGGGRADHVSPRRHVVEHGRPITRLSEEPVGPNVPAVGALIHRVGVAAQLQEALDVLDRSRHAVAEDVGRVERVLEEIARALLLAASRCALHLRHLRLLRLLRGCRRVERAVWRDKRRLSGEGLCDVALRQAEVLQHPPLLVLLGRALRRHVRLRGRATRRARRPLAVGGERGRVRDEWVEDGRGSKRYDRREWQEVCSGEDEKTTGAVPCRLESS